MTKGISFALVAVAFGLGFAIGRSTDKAGGGGGDDSVAVTASAGDVEIAGTVERVKVPAEGGANAKGSEDALVTIVAFSDFQCPFCGRVNPTIDRLVSENKGKVRVVFRHYPLPFHTDAPLAAQAAMAAGEQGKFWEMHDKMFANQRAIKREDLDKYAQEIGLDAGKFKAALDTSKFKQAVEDDTALGSRLGVQGTPHFFVNGRVLSGAQPYESFKEIVDDELARADKLVASGTPKRQVYAKLMAAARAPGSPSPAAPAAPSPAAPAQPSPDQVYKVLVGDSPAKGSKAPKVTIIAFSEFQCPFCSRVLETLRQIESEYKNDVQMVFKHLPLAFHDNAKPAAQASEAARLQGKFWEMHDKLFANQTALTRPDLDRYAQEIGLNMGKFAKDFDSKDIQDRIARDSALAATFGARGTPNFFINGRSLRGAQPLPAFKAVIDEEIKKANQKLKEGVAPKNLYAELIKNGLEKVADAPAPAAAGAAPAAGGVVKIPLGDSPSKGATDALVTIVQFSDYQCPFCSRVEPTIDRIMTEYKDKVRVVWKDLPLSFHNNAKPAAIAARAAEQQGKFWQMHKKMFENQSALDAPNLEKYAQEIGLNMAKFKSALSDAKVKAVVESDEALAGKVGATGTPAFFINGIKLSGAQPFESFKATIDAEVTKAQALVAKGTPRKKIYDEIMKGGSDAPAPPPAAAGEAAAGPEADQTVFKVATGNAPSRGPKNAPITLVVFSEFQCPFCSRVKPTIDQVEKEYPGKVRVVFKNFPLPFHNNAKPASAAALAAHEQGKFWEMHDKMFQNQTALDRPNLEKYAQEIGLNMAKFKATMDSPQVSAQIDADMKEGQSVGVNGTPATFINGRKVSGAYPYPTFKAIVDQELAKLKKGG